MCGLRAVTDQRVLTVIRPLYDDSLALMSRENGKIIVAAQLEMCFSQLACSLCRPIACRVSSNQWQLDTCVNHLSNLRYFLLSSKCLSATVALFTYSILCTYSRCVSHSCTTTPGQLSRGQGCSELSIIIIHCVLN